MQILQTWNLEQIDTAESMPGLLDALGTAATAERPYDLVFVDLPLPGATERQVIQTIKGQTAPRAPRIVELRTLNLGKPITEVDAWLTKPISQSDLFDALTGLYGKAVARVDHEPRHGGIGTGGSVAAGCCWWKDNPVNQDVACEILARAGFDQGQQRQHRCHGGP